MDKEHFYNLTIDWTGNKGKGTANYSSYERSFSISTENKVKILGSSDPLFLGDNTKYNPEEFLVSSLSSCYMLWFLHLCAVNGVIVINYIDNPTGIMIETQNGSGQFKSVTLNPTVTILKSITSDKLDSIHKKAKESCFIANSVNFPLLHNPTYIIEEK